MKSTDVIKAMSQEKLRFITVDALQEVTGQSHEATKMALSRLNEEGVVLRIKRGLYVNNLAPDIHEYEALPYLTAPHPSYVTLFSILSDQGLVDDMTPAVFGVTTGNSSGYRTEVGIYRVYHIKEEMMWGYDVKKYKHGERAVADPEKAFLDLVYLSKTPSRDISLPGNWLDIYRELDRDKFRTYVEKADMKRLANFLREAEKELDSADEPRMEEENDTIKMD